MIRTVDTVGVRVPKACGNLETLEHKEFKRHQRERGPGLSLRPVNLPTRQLHAERIEHAATTGLGHRVQIAYSLLASVG